MMQVDEFAAQLLDEAKRFLEKASAEATPEGKEAYLHAALLVGFAALEAHINSVSDDFLVRPDLSSLDRSVLEERELALEDGVWTLTDRLKIYRIEDRLQYLHNRFSLTPLDKNSSTWSDLKGGLYLRNKITHPRAAEPLKQANVGQALGAILASIDALYVAVYKRPFPAARRGIQSQMTF